MADTSQTLRLGFAAASFLALIGAVVFAVRAFGSGNVYVVAPDASPLTVHVDDGEPVTIPAGQHKILLARQGAHTLTYELAGQSTTSNLRMPNGWSSVLAAPKGYCFGEFDVTESAYAHGSTQHLPKVIATFSGDQSHVLSGEPKFSPSEYPKTAPDHGRVIRIAPMPCEYVGHADGDVLASSGMTKSG